MKKASVVVFLFVFLAGMAGPVLAADSSNVCTWAESKNWGVSAPGKLTRGVINLGLGWTNLFVQPFREETVMGGIGKGLSDFFLRAVQGAAEIVLFWLPPVPEEPLRECVFFDWGAMERRD